MAGQSWHTCRHALGNLDTETPEKMSPQAKAFREFFPVSNQGMLFREHGIHRFYYCTCPGMLEETPYRKTNLYGASGEKFPVIQLTSLTEINEERARLSCYDPSDFQEYVNNLKNEALERLAMCTHCKFYTKRETT